jgi:hypothetical protein
LHGSRRVTQNRPPRQSEKMSRGARSRRRGEPAGNRPRCRYDVERLTTCGRIRGCATRIIGNGGSGSGRRRSRSRARR